MPNGTYGGVRGKETKIGRKTYFVSLPTRLKKDVYAGSLEFQCEASFSFLFKAKKRPEITIISTAMEIPSLTVCPSSISLGAKKRVIANPYMPKHNGSQKDFFNFLPDILIYNILNVEV